MVFGEKAEGVIGGEGVVRDGRSRNGTGNGSEGGVVVVGGDAIARFKVHHLRHIFIAIASIEEFITCATLSKERSRRHGFGWVPNEEVNLRVVVSEAMVFSHTKPLRQFCLC